MKRKLDALKNTERIALLAGILQPLMILPQIYTVFMNKSAEDVSLATWAGTLVLGLPILAYGIVHKLRPIITTQIINATLQLVAVVGILLYK